MQLALARILAFALTAAAAPVLTPSTATAQRAPGECVVVQPLDGSAQYLSDPAECAVKTSPASRFKIPHALIALETGVVPSPLEIVNWDETLQPFREWERGHSLDSAVKCSVVWFFQRTAEWIGRQRMLEYLERLGYAEDSFENDLTLFWLNGDLVARRAARLPAAIRPLRATRSPPAR
jgi:beta-lactamase class D